MFHSNDRENILRIKYIANRILRPQKMYFSDKWTVSGSLRRWLEIVSGHGKYLICQRKMKISIHESGLPLRVLKPEGLFPAQEEREAARDEGGMA